MGRPLKKFAFVSAAAEREYKELPKDVQDDFGKDLRRIQYGQDPVRPFKSLTESVGAGGDRAHHKRQPGIPMRVCGQVRGHGRRAAFVRKNDQQVRPARDAGRPRANEGAQARVAQNGVQSLAARRLGDHDLGR